MNPLSQLFAQLGFCIDSSRNNGNFVGGIVIENGVHIMAIKPGKCLRIEANIESFTRNILDETLLTSPESVLMILAHSRYIKENAPALFQKILELQTEPAV